MATANNVQKLEKAGVIPEGYTFDAKEKRAISKLTPVEVNALIRAKDKLGVDFFAKHASHGMMF